MDKLEAQWEVCGLEVSAEELVVAVAKKTGAVQWLRFANDAVGHGGCWALSRVGGDA